MGHYYGEMVDVKAEQTERQLYRSDLEDGIEKTIADHGMVSMLADMLQDLHISGVRNTCHTLGRRMRIDAEAAEKKDFIEEGDPCPEDDCAGLMYYPPVRGCTCFQNAPCSACTNNQLECHECEAQDPDWVAP